MCTSRRSVLMPAHGGGGTGLRGWVLSRVPSRDPDEVLLRARRSSGGSRPSRAPMGPWPGAGASGDPPTSVAVAGAAPRPHCSTKQPCAEAPCTHGTG